MSFLGLFIGGLFGTFVVSRFGNWLFGRFMAPRTAAITTFVVVAGITLLAAATRIVPARPAILYFGVPLILWLLIDLSRSKKRDCPHCGRRIPNTAMTCPRCGRDLDTGATVIDDPRQQ